MQDALRVFGEKGFDAATAEDVAEASGISRATFFRRYGSKEDVVFADHESLIARVEQLLDQSSGDPYTAICEATVFVLDQLMADTATARARFELVRTVPVLREREILTIRRYEVLFVRHLRSRLPEGDGDQAVGFAAAVVAVHNAAQREWLTGDRDVTLESFAARVRRIATRFQEPEPPVSAERVIAARFDLSAPRAEILRRIGEFLD